MVKNETCDRQKVFAVISCFAEISLSTDVCDALGRKSLPVYASANQHDLIAFLPRLEVLQLKNTLKNNNI